MSRAAAILPAAALALTLSASSCAVSAGAVTALEAGVKREREELQAMKGLRAALDDYAYGLQRSAFKAPRTFVFLGPGDLQRALSAYLPHRIAAADLFGAGSGELEVVSADQPRLEARNRLRLRLTLAARDLTAGDEASGGLARALAAGAVAEVAASVTYDAAYRFAAVRPACLSVSLGGTEDPGTRARVVDLLNRRVFDRSVPVPVPPLANRPAEAIFLTGDHVVVQYPQ